MSQPNERTDEPTNPPVDGSATSPSGEAAQWVAPLKHEQRNARPADLVRYPDDTPRGPRPPATWWFTTLLVLGYLASIAWGMMDRDYIAETYVLLTISLALLQLTIIWLALSSWPFSLRILTLFAVGALGMAAQYLQQPQDLQQPRYLQQPSMIWRDSVESLVATVMLIGFLALPLSGMSFAGWRFVRMPLPVGDSTAPASDGGAALAKRRGWFKSLMKYWRSWDPAFTTILSLGLVYYAQPRIHNADFRIFSQTEMLLVGCLGYGLISYMTVWAIFGPGDRAKRWLAPMGAMQLFVVLLLFRFKITEGLAMATAVVQGPLIVTMLVLCFYRYAGYRLIRIRQESLITEGQAHVAAE
ncbi:MAG: hypothetical protein SGJ20_11650 [Planctomycetota bacterium]|nr:hypothetical protein [Planctomycetota bacterium]